MFYLCNTLPHPGSSTPGGSPQPTQAKLHQPLYSCYHTASSSYCYLALQDIMQVLWAFPLHHPHLCVNPAFIECCSLYTSSAIELFSCKVDALLIKHVGCWGSDAMLCYLHVQSHPIMSRLSKVMLAGWWQSPVLSRNRHHAPTQPIPLIFGLITCQNHYCSPGMV